MHVKTLIIDRVTLMTGSVNMTHNGFENNKEHLYRMTEPSVVLAVAEDFESAWESAEIVTQEMIDDMLARHRTREEKKKSNQSRGDRRSRSQSVSRGVSRSLSRELAEVGDTS